MFLSSDFAQHCFFCFGRDGPPAGIRSCSPLSWGARLGLLLFAWHPFLARCLYPYCFLFILFFYRLYQKERDGLATHFNGRWAGLGGNTKSGEKRRDKREKAMRYPPQGFIIFGFDFPVIFILFPIHC